MDAGRADTMMIVSINPTKKSIKLISIPRDTYVNVPGYGNTKIKNGQMQRYPILQSFFTERQNYFLSITFLHFAYSLRQKKEVVKIDFFIATASMFFGD